MKNEKDTLKLFAKSRNTLCRYLKICLRYKFLYFFFVLERSLIRIHDYSSSIVFTENPFDLKPAIHRNKSKETCHTGNADQKSVYTMVLIYKMVTQIMVRTCKEKQFVFWKWFQILTAIDKKNCLRQFTLPISVYTTLAYLCLSYHLIKVLLSLLYCIFEHLTLIWIRVQRQSWIWIRGSN